MLKRCAWAAAWQSAKQGFSQHTLGYLISAALLMEVVQVKHVL